MQTRDPSHESRIPALLSGVVVAVVLLAFVPPVRADGTTDLRDRSPSTPTVSGDSTAAPEHALHRVHAGTAGAMVRLAHPAGCLPDVVQPPAFPRCNGRPDDSVAVALPASGVHLRILFCTWLN